MAKLPKQPPSGGAKPAKKPAGGKKTPTGGGTPAGSGTRGSQAGRKSGKTGKRISTNPKAPSENPLTSGAATPPGVGNKGNKRKNRDAGARRRSALGAAATGPRQPAANKQPGESARTASPGKGKPPQASGGGQQRGSLTSGTASPRMPQRRPTKPDSTTKKAANAAVRQGANAAITGVTGGTAAPVVSFVTGLLGNDEKAKKNRRRLYIAAGTVLFIQLMAPVVIISIVVGIALMGGGTGASGTAKPDAGQCLDINAPRVTQPGGGRTGAGAGTLGAPLDTQYMQSASGFGQREAPTAGATSWHDGIDFSGPGIHGKPIYAPAAGIVDQAGPAQGYGNWIIINHDINGQKVSTLYGHIDDGHVFVRAGQRVQAGDHIADVGNSGVSTGPHLHFGVYPGGWKQGKGVDPMPWLSKFKATAHQPNGSTRSPPADTGAAVRPGEPAATPAGVVSKADWQKLAQCESGGNWKINTGNGFSGGIQFTQSSWAAAGGTDFAASPHLATPEQQMEAANKLLRMQGWGAWPTCSAKQQLTGLKPAPEGTFARKDGTAATPGAPQPNQQPAETLPPTTHGDERNLQAAAQRGMRLVGKEFPEVTEIGGFRSGPNARDHGDGSAIDVSIPDYTSASGIALGDKVAARFIDNAGELKVKYVIWRNRIWQNGQWSDYGNTGSDNDKHNNHLHISFAQSGRPTATVLGLPGPDSATTPGPDGIQPYTPEGAQKSQTLTPEQQANIKALIAGAKRAGIKPEGRAAVLAVAYAGAQTNFISLTPTPQDPRIGIFGEIPLEGAADTSNLINVPYAANAFYQRLKRVAAADPQWSTKPLSSVLVAVNPEQATRAPEFGTWEQLSIGSVTQLWDDRYSRADAALQSVTNIDCSQGGVLGRTLKPGSVPQRFIKWITLAGQICEGITAPLLAAQIEAESGLSEEPGVSEGATSPDGAMGSSQFMPGTWQTWGKKVDQNGKAVGPGGSGDPRNVADATMAQGHMMCADYDNIKKLIASGRIKGDPVALTIAAYNAGLGAVLAAGGMPSGGDYSTQTQPYVEKIMARARDFDGGGGQLSPGASSGGYIKAVEMAMAQRGKPYVWGATGPDSYDCSGLTQAAYKAAGMNIPRTTYEQIKLGREVPLAQAKPGDLVFSNFSSNGPEHVSMYIGGNKVVEAQQEGVPVLVSPMPKGQIVIKHIDKSDTETRR